MMSVTQVREKMQEKGKGLFEQPTNSCYAATQHCLELHMQEVQETMAKTFCSSKNALASAPDHSSALGQSVILSFLPDAMCCKACDMPVSNAPLLIPHCCLLHALLQ